MVVLVIVVFVVIYSVIIVLVVTVCRLEPPSSETATFSTIGEPRAVKVPKVKTPPPSA